MNESLVIISCIMSLTLYTSCLEEDCLKKGRGCPKFSSYGFVNHRVSTDLRSNMPVQI
ncbi:hypothetical protein OIU77_016618 [Salix suchowensis]|uniref:Uncharacterized protein n=1 Tax=Salix suchowensis TaxID=1278906 RepID=A0ABQ8ZLD7_9ROSI|nr:hypothetical protein OIU77_016618 [Salix suchowensis]